MNQRFVTATSLLALVIASLFAVTFSTLPQSWALILLLPAVCICTFKLFKNHHNFKGTWLFWFLILGITYTTLRAYFSLSQDLAMQDIFVLAAFVFAMVIALDAKACGSFEKPFLLVVSGIVILNLLMYIPAVNEWRDSIWGYANGKWNTGFYNHRNFYSNFMALCSCILISKSLLTKESSKLKWVYLLLGLASSISVFLAMARGGAMGLISGLTVISIWFILSKPKSSRGIPRWLQFSFLIFAIVAVVTGSNLVFKKRNMNVADDHRMNYYSMAIDQVAEAPLIGSGSRSVEYRSYRHWHPNLYRTKDFKFTHNEFLQVAADYGIIGFILLTGVLICYICSVGGAVFHKIVLDESISMEVAGLSCVAVMTINSLVSFPMHAFPNMLLLGLVFGLSISQRNHVTEGFKKTAKPIILSSMALCGSVILLFAVTAVPVVKEALASIQFIKQGLVVDDANWAARNNDSEEWERALVNATQHSSTYLRENKLGNIYLHHYEKSGEKKYLDQAEDRFVKAKARHSEDPVSRLNLAYIYRLRGEYKRSINEYTAVMPMIIHREEEFNSVFRIIQAELGLINVKLRSNKVEEARSLLKVTLDRCRMRFNMRGGADPSFYDLYENVLLKYLGLIDTKLGKEEKAMKSLLIEEYINIGKRRSPAKQPERLIAFSHNLNKLAREVWVDNRDPQGAINILHYSRYYLYRVRSVNPDIVESSQYQEALEEMQKIINFLQKAGFKVQLK